MKRLSICLLIISICLFGGTCFAASSDQEKMEANSLISMIKEVGYRFDGGINWITFSSLYNDLYVKERVFIDKYPTSPIKSELRQNIQLLADIKMMWDPTNRHTGGTSNQEDRYLMATYPEIGKEATKGWLGNWDDKDITYILMRKNPSFTARLVQSYKDNYENPVTQAIKIEVPINEIQKIVDASVNIQTKADEVMSSYKEWKTFYNMLVRAETAFSVSYPGSKYAKNIAIMMGNYRIVDLLWELKNLPSSDQRESDENQKKMFSSIAAAKENQEKTLKIMIE